MKKIALAFMAVATLVMVGCGKKKDEPNNGNQGNGQTEISEVIAQYNDSIKMSTLLPGYKTYTATVDNPANAFIEGEMIYVGCIGETTLHITGDETAKKDIKLTVVPRLPEEYMFTIPNLDWTRNRAALIKELGEPTNRIGWENMPEDSCYAYYMDKEAASPFVYFYFNGDDFNTLNEILVSILDNDHGEVLKLFVAERFPFFGKNQAGETTVWEYLNAPYRSQATTRILYYVQNGWNVSFYPYSYGK